MGIPHSTADYVHLRKAVELPAPKAAPRTNTRSHRAQTAVAEPTRRRRPRRSSYTFESGKESLRRFM